MEKGELVSSGQFQVDMEAMERKTTEEFKKISNLKVNIFFKQFPFLMKYVNPLSIKSAGLFSIDEKFLEKIIANYCGDHNLILLDGNGEELTRVGRILNRNVPWYKPYPRSRTIGEEIQYLEKLGKSKDAQFVLEIHNYEIIVLYKPPKGFAISDWVQEKIKRVSDNLQAQIHSIDAEGSKQ